MGARGTLPRTAKGAAGQARVADGAGMAGAGSSQRQKAISNTISTVVLALIRPAAREALPDLYSVCLFRRAGPARQGPRHDGLGPGICAAGCRWHRPASVLSWCLD